LAILAKLEKLDFYDEKLTFCQKICVGIHLMTILLKAMGHLMMIMTWESKIFHYWMTKLTFPAVQQAHPVGPPANPDLRPNGKQWFEDGEVSVDVGLLNRRTRLIWPGNANLLGDPLPVRPELD
jgi:hypothetical protein